MANTKITNPELFNLGDSTSATQLPVMTTTERIAMTGLSVGETIFNSTTDKVEYFDGTKWYGINYKDVYPTSLKMYLNSTDTASYSGSGTAWNDLTSNSNNATLANITQPSSTFLTWNGSSSYAVLPSDPDIGAGANWSVSMWVYERTSQVTNYNMIDYAHSLNGGWTIQGGVYYVKNSAGQYSSMSVNITSNTWNHLVISSNGSTATNIYINNVATAASPTSMPNVTWNVGYDFTAGAWNNQAGSYARNWNGDMTKIQIYNTNLSVAEVNTLFLEGKGF